LLSKSETPLSTMAFIGIYLFISNDILF